MTNAELITKAHTEAADTRSVRGETRELLGRLETDALIKRFGTPYPLHQDICRSCGQEYALHHGSACPAKEGCVTTLPDLARCGAYAESWEWLDKPTGWLGCSLPKGHEGFHRDEELKGKEEQP